MDTDNGFLFSTVLSVTAELWKKVKTRWDEVKPVYAYCLFCETQRCRPIAEYISRNYGYQCISPKIIQRKWIKSEMTAESHDWLPGYIFLYTEELIMPHFYINGIIRCLGNRELSGMDLSFAEMIYRLHGVMGTVSLVREGDYCKINDPAWKEMNGKVIKMDHGRKRCCIEFEFDGIRRTVWAGYEIIETQQQASIQRC